MGYFFFRIWGKLFIEIFFHFLAYCCHPKSLFTFLYLFVYLIFRLEKQLLAWHEISEALLLPSIPKHPIWCFLTGYIQVYISLFTIYWISCLFTFFNLIFFFKFLSSLYSSSSASSGDLVPRSSSDNTSSQIVCRVSPESIPTIAIWRVLPQWNTFI